MNLISTPEGSKIPAALTENTHAFIFFVMTEIYNKKQDPNYAGIFTEFIDLFPSNADDFPYSFSDDELNLLAGSRTKGEILSVLVTWKEYYN